MAVIYFNHPEAIFALVKMAKVRFQPGYDQCLARFECDTFLGGILYTDNNGGSIQMHIGSVTKRWIDRAILWLAFDYPFNKLRVNKIFGVTPESNKIALDFNANAGFNMEARILDVFPNGEAAIVQGLYRKDCRFLKMREPRITFGSIGNG